MINESHRNGSFSSTNWDGYVVTNTAGTNATTFNAVSATWVQPAVTCNAAGSVGSSWVGFDGWVSGSTSVEQGGNAADTTLKPNLGSGGNWGIPPSSTT